MEKRFLLAVVLCLIILMFWQSYMGKKQEEWKKTHGVSQTELEQEPEQARPSEAKEASVPSQEALPTETQVEEQKALAPHSQRVAGRAS